MPYGNMRDNEDDNNDSRTWSRQMIDVVFTIPRNLWVSMNRATSGHGHTARIRREIQAIAAITLRNARVEPFEGRVTVV